MSDRAAKAHTDLNIFAVIVSILEGGHIYLNESQEVADEIIKLCQKHQRICLRIHDRALSDSKKKDQKP